MMPQADFNTAEQLHEASLRTMARTVAAMWSEFATLELKAARAIQARAGGNEPLRFPWRRGEPWNGQERRHNADMLLCRSCPANRRRPRPAVAPDLRESGQ